MSKQDVIDALAPWLYSKIFLRGFTKADVGPVHIGFLVAIHPHHTKRTPYQFFLVPPITKEHHVFSKQAPLQAINVHKAGVEEVRDLIRKGLSTRRTSTVNTYTDICFGRKIRFGSERSYEYISIDDIMPYGVRHAEQEAVASFLARPPQPLHISIIRKKYRPALQVSAAAIAPCLGGPSPASRTTIHLPIRIRFNQALSSHLVPVLPTDPRLHAWLWYFESGFQSLQIDNDPRYPSVANKGFNSLAAASRMLLKRDCKVGLRHWQFYHNNTWVDGPSLRYKTTWKNTTTRPNHYATVVSVTPGVAIPSPSRAQTSGEVVFSLRNADTYINTVLASEMASAQQHTLFNMPNTNVISTPTQPDDIALGRFEDYLRKHTGSIRFRTRSHTNKRGAPMTRDELLQRWAQLPDVGDPSKMQFLTTTRPNVDGHADTRMDQEPSPSSEHASASSLPLYDLEAECPPVPPLRSIPVSLWTDDCVAQFLARCPRFSIDDPHLSRITHFRRYGPGLKYEFKCIFRTWNRKSQSTHWVKYIHLLPNKEYMKMLQQNYGWDPNTERTLNLQDLEEDEGSDVGDWGMDGIHGAVVPIEEPMRCRRMRPSPQQTCDNFAGFGV